MCLCLDKKRRIRRVESRTTRVDALPDEACCWATFAHKISYNVAIHNCIRAQIPSRIFFSHFVIKPWTSEGQRVMMMTHNDTRKPPEKYYEQNFGCFACAIEMNDGANGCHTHYFIGHNRISSVWTFVEYSKWADKWMWKWEGDTRQVAHTKTENIRLMNAISMERLKGMANVFIFPKVVFICGGAGLRHNKPVLSTEKSYNIQLFIFNHIVSRLAQQHHSSDARTLAILEHRTKPQVDPIPHWQSHPESNSILSHSWILPFCNHQYHHRQPPSSKPIRNFTTTTTAVAEATNQSWIWHSAAVVIFSCRRAWRASIEQELVGVKN